MSGVTGEPIPSWLVGRLRCPVTGLPLRRGDARLVTDGGDRVYETTPSGIPLFAEAASSPEGRAQARHYDGVAKGYLANLRYPHTEEYTAFLDGLLLDRLPPGSLGDVAEICCGGGEGLRLLRGRFESAIGVDVSLVMLEGARRSLPDSHVAFVQADATMLPLRDEVVDHVLILGGVHHVLRSAELFGEVRRILRPGGRLLFREPLDDFPLWRGLRALVYRLSPALDAKTERPLRRRETVPALEEAGLVLEDWRACAFLGFCALMNSDVLVANRLLRFVPGIRAVAAAAAVADDRLLRLPGLRRAGLQVVAAARKPLGA